ncbi:hypothetical protein [Chitinilyticum piscinae]|uniref:Sel1 repeat family protein n=1 Tax=Chitinilyticum piscinae TaxID=2866724 RepID=A0A8J7FLT1_9NEIS|nr:hypothetical protein [Chitinilyticum piscinae]MBE9610242.1 hypothetical protein [Chitinilyticum piscinae]
MPLRHFCITTLFLLGCSQAATLEQLFEQKQFAEFQPKALAAAEQGDAQALFLQGKAHHLHLIKTPDAADYDEAEELELAHRYYEQARAKGSARASHNLGLLLIEQGDKPAGIALLEEALARGMKVPTLQVLARAVSPDAPLYLVDADTIRAHSQSGDYFAAALAAQPDVLTLEQEAAGQYLRAYLYYLKARTDVQEEFDQAALRQRVISWLSKGQQRNNPAAWANYGILLMEEANAASGRSQAADYAQARAALERGAALNNPVAHFQLAELAYAGRGLPQRDFGQALQHYEAAALLGLKVAVEPARQQLLQALAGETDLAKLETGKQRLAALHRIDPQAFAFPDSALEDRIAWGELLASEKAAAKPLPALPLSLTVCGLGRNESSLGEGLDWWLVAYEEMYEAVKVPIQGRIDRKGCVRAKGKTLDPLRPYLERGAITALAFPGLHLPLISHISANSVQLELRDQDSAQPPQ